MVNTHGMMVTNQPLNARVNSSIGKTSSTGENSFDKKVSKTPKAPGTQRHAQVADSEFTSNSSTADKNQYATQ